MFHLGVIQFFLDNLSLHLTSVFKVKLFYISVFCHRNKMTDPFTNTFVFVSLLKYPKIMWDWLF